MATNWSHLLEILAAISDSPLHPEAVPELCKVLNNGSSDILNLEDEHEEFFSCVVAFSAHFIGLHVSSCSDSLHHPTGACKVILQFCLARIKKERDKSLSKKNLVAIIEGLCKGRGCLDQAEITTFVEKMKQAKYPKCENDQKDSAETTKTEFYGKLTRQGLLNTNQRFSRMPFARHRMFGFEDDMIDIKTYLSNANISTLRKMQGGEILLDLCTSLPNISQFITLHGMSGSKPSMKMIDGLTIENMLLYPVSRAPDLASEMSLISSIASIPVMEPLNSYRLNKIMLLTLGCVDIAMYAASGYLTTTAIEDVDEIAKQLVDTSLSIVDTVSHTLSTSHRAGGHIVQNFNLLITHCILKGLASLAKNGGINQDRASETRWEGLNILRMELSKKVIGILSSLLEDLKMESSDDESSANITAEEMNIEVHVSAWCRVKLLFDHLELVPLLMGIFIRSYHKADYLSETTLSSAKGSDQSKSTSNDAETKSNNSNEDSSEGDTLFGDLFDNQTGEQETSAPETETKSWKNESKMAVAESYLEMSKTILVFITDYMLNNISPNLMANIQQTLPTSHLTDLASLVMELDGAKTYIGTLSTCYSFNQCLDRYLHTLLTFGVLTDEQQETILKQLGVSPHSREPWPLYIGPRSLSILARVLLGRQESCRETGDERDDESCVKIWERLIQTLRDMALNERRRPDVNVEQLQLLLLVWHNFTKKQRDKILMLCIISLCAISQDHHQSEKVPLHLMRLFAILDYMLYQYNQPPRELITQVQYNLFKTKLSYMAMLHMDDDMMDEPRLVFFPTVEREDKDNYRPTGDPLGHTYEKRTPRFYGLRSGDEKELPEDMFKHLQVILEQGNSSYSYFYTCLIAMLSAGLRCDVLKRQKSKYFNLSDAKIVRCLFGLSWRLLISLPPPPWFLRGLQKPHPLQLKNAQDFVRVLVTMYWSTKLSTTDDPSIVKNALEGQNLSADEAVPLTLSIFTAACDDVRTIIQATDYLQQIFDGFTYKDEVLSAEHLPGLLTLITVDCIVARISTVLKTKLVMMTEALKVEIEKLFAVVLKLMKAYQGFARFSLLSHQNVLSKVRDQDIGIYSKVIKISSSAVAKNPLLAGPVITSLPIPMEEIKQWNNLGSVDFNPLFSPEDIINEGSSDPVQVMQTLLSSHFKVMSFRFPFSLDASIRHAMKSLIQLISTLLTKCPEEDRPLHSVFAKEISAAITPLVVDASAEYLFEESILESVFESLDHEECANQIQNYLLEKCYELMIEHSLSVEPVLPEDIFVDCERFMESLLERPQGRTTLQSCFENNDKFVRLLLLSANENFSLSFVYRMLKFVSRTLETYEKQPNDATALALVQSISMISEVDSGLLTTWLNRIIVGSVTDKEMTGKMADNRLLLQSIVSFLVKEQSPVSSLAIETLLDSIIPLGTLLIRMAADESVVIGSKFGDFLSISSTLAGYGDGNGHLKLMKAVVKWLQTCKCDLDPNMIGDGKAKENTNSFVECTNVLLAHVADVLIVLKQTDDDDMCSGCHGDDHIVSDVESDGVDDEEDSGAEESEEDVEGNHLWNKLCTFTATRKEFANQHWYHCHTCRMNDGVGVCTICAKVCHKNHDVTYAKFGSFFCDCGAKEDDSCKAMKKRNPHDISDMASPDEKVSTLSSYRRSLQPLVEARGSVSTEPKSEDTEKREKEKSSYEFGQPTFRRDLRKQIEPNKKALIKVITENNMCETLLTLLSTLARISNQGNQVVGGARQRITEALQGLHAAEKTVENNEQLLVPTSGSQEGAFENVKLVCNGEQGQAIRQLIGTHVLRRVAMCCLTSAKGRRQHLAVNHEKGKITILQLSSLLKQADSSRRKLTITRLATTQVPFTILSLTGNICNEDFLAVSGLKDCHVLTLSSSGSVVNHLVLHPQLETGNFIVKTMWLPGSQTELAIVTADFVQIYDLSKDALSPVFYFVLPAGKIRDVTFIFQSSQRHMCLMSSEGLIYTQQLDESSSAKSGPFYLTNIIPVVHEELKDNNGQVAGGGVSVYYSHGLQMLFFSYVQGKTFVAPWTENLSQISKLFPINVKPSNGNKSAPATLCQWSEVLEHPGLMLCLTHTTGLPIVLMIQPGDISYQEIKSASSKSKIQDVVAIRHSLSNSDQSRTTVILLCEDGSLKIYMASQEQAGFWMSPAFQPTSAVASLKPIKPRKSKKHVRIKTSSSPHFPVDFFEHCQVLNDVEYGGKDILQVYNVQQVKHRLMTAGMYIACTKSNSFSMTVKNCNPSVVMVGVRVLVGCQAIDKAPTFLEVFGRVIDVEVKRNRWFDIPFTREEVLSTDRTVTLTFGQSQDTSNVTMIDSIKVYCKSKEVFGWPDDLQDEGLPPPTPTPTTVPPVSPFTQNSEVLANTTPLSLKEIMTANSLRALDGFVSLVSGDEERTYQQIVTIATSLLSSPLPQQVQEQAKMLLASLHPTKMTYYNHKDHAQLTYVVNCLYNKKSSAQDDIDSEVFERLVVMTRAVAVNRPENLVKFTKELTENFASASTDGPLSFPLQLISTFWRFYRTQPSNSSLVTVVHSGMHYAEMIIFALVEILHAFIVTDTSFVPLIELYVQLLLSQDTRVSFACKQALAFVLRPSSRRPPAKTEENKSAENKPEQAPSAKTNNQVDGTVQAGEGGSEAPEQSVAGGAEQSVDEVAEHPREAGDDGEEEIMNIAPPWDMNQEEEVPVPDLPEPGPSSGGRGASSAAGNRLQVLLNAGFPSVYELPPDADDEAMMELAIALSLQEQGEEAAMGLHHLLGEAIENGGPVDEGEGSSSSASGHASEDDLEPTTRSMDLVQIQAEAAAQQSSQDLGSVSEGSAESLSGENPGDDQDRQEDAMESESGVGATPKPDDQTEHYNMCKYDADVREKMHNLNLIILRTFIDHFYKLDNISGVQAIPFMQVLLMLCFDLDNDEDDNSDLLHQVFAKCLEVLRLDSADITDIATRTSPREVQLIIMRFLSVLMSRSKSGGKTSSQQTSSMSSQVAASLFENNIMDHCLAILNRLMQHWQAREKTGNTEDNVVTLLKPQHTHSPPDMSPFFLKQYVKSHASDIFEAYPLLVTEMVLRLTYQVKKIADGSSDGEMKDLPEDWFTCLFEYMMIQQSSFVKIKRQVRKLLLFLCGSKETYREQRDSHALDVHFRDVRRICDESGFNEQEQTPMNIEYDTLLDLIEHLKAAADIASNRTKNWQAYCLKNQSTLSFLFKVSFIINEGVTATILQLLTTALCEGDSQKDSENKNPGDVYQQLVQQLTKHVDMEAMRQFVRCFLLLSNSTSIRWQAHSLLYSVHRNSEGCQQDSLSDMLWSVWPDLPAFGRKASQFVDLLGYFTIKRSLSDDKAAEFSEKAIALLKKQNEILRNHANSNVYRLLSGLVNFDGFYLESDPCLVCNNPEVPYNISKLSALKTDSRFSTTSHMVKLVGSHNISKVTLRVTDVKRQKMVKTINLYYNNRSVQSVVELKNKSAVWHKAKKCHLIQGQTEVKIEFPLPIVACNLMIEYADFYENLQASSETLQCPRCSAPVPANPGVCGNCGENVYQCHKCRCINYDEKDPFLCNACGFCKYAKFDLTLTAKPCCAVDPIENEEDRKKAVTSINTLLDRADKMYRQLVAHRQPLDSLLMKIAEQGDNDFVKSETSHGSSSSSSGNASSQAVNKSIQAVAQRYCIDCKGSFDELSKITQKVLASRKELIEYDTRVRDRVTSKITCNESTQARAPAKQLSTVSDAQSVPGRCYGCSSAATEHCVTLLKALAMKTSTRDKLIKEGLIHELVNFTLYQGTSSIRNNVRDLLCLLTRNNPDASEQLNSVLVNRVKKGMKEQSVNPSVSSSISRDMQLLTKTVELEDSCWEQRLQCVTQIFLLSVQHVSPIVVQAITLPCLKILSQFIKPKPATTKNNVNKTINEIASVKAIAAPIANMKDWIESKPEASYEEWVRQVSQESEASEASPQETSVESVDDLDEEWLRNVMFSPSCGALRQVACSIVETLCQISGRKRKIMDLLTSYLQDVGEAGENAAEFFNLYSELMKSSSWKGYLATSEALLTIRDLITKEIDQLTVLEETTLSSDLSQGYSLKRLTELMASFVEDKKIKQDFKAKLVGAVLNGYLSLRRLVVQRTKLVDQSQEILLNLLGELTSGTESETKKFMAICVNTLNRYELDDLRTPVFIFERLCNIIYPEENDTSEFQLLLEKDPQQEDFLQGRMLGNPYKSTDTGMGPLMRDVKNKICTDCDLIALLEDDTGMELLVNSKIISLDLPVKEVYKKIWCPQGEGEPMKVVYRMRGLLGDATEDIVEHLDKNNQKGVDNEIVYKMANVMNECGGLEAILKRLSGLRDLTRGRQLLEVILKLFGFCVKVKANRDYLAKPSLKTLKILLDVLNEILHFEQATPSGIGSMAEQILSIIEALLQGGGANMKLMIAAGQEEEESQLEMLLEIIKTPYVRSNNNVLLSLMHILPFLTFGDKKSKNALIDHFEPYLNFEKFDKTHSDDELLFLECFCNIADGIENDENGNQLKNIIIDKGLVQQAVQYLELYTPSQSFSTSNLSDTDLWKEFLARPSLPFILKFLSGMCKGHERSQLAVSETAVPTIHRLEQVSSEEKVGSLAENLMEALKEHPDAKAKVTAVRRETRQEKKKLAMAMRLKQLGALGMSATESGKIITKPSAVIQGFEEISNETGLTCCICREGYKYHPNKVLGIYTYTKRCILDSFEVKQRKSQGYSTVSHFNIVHYECHVAAIRLARGRDEWESAALQNSNTKCNGLLPIWGPQVPESSFASCLARHNNYIQEATSHIEPTFQNTVHDLRLLLERFAFEKSFNEDSGGGGRQSNFNIIPYMVHMALYVMNTARMRSLEKSVTTFVEEGHSTWIQSSFEVNGPLFVSVLSLFTNSLEEWKKTRIIFLSRLIVLAHVRDVSPKGATKLSDGEVKPYNVYRPILIFFALVNKLQHMLKEHVSSASTWSQDVASYIRNNDEKILKSCEELLGFYQDDLLPASSFPEFCDVSGLLGEISDPAKFITDIFNSLPK